MPHVVIRSSTRAAALPALLPASPRVTRPSSSTTAPPTGRATSPARAGAIVVEEPARGFGAACWAGLLAAAPETASCAHGPVTAHSTRSTSCPSPHRCWPRERPGPRRPPAHHRGACPCTPGWPPVPGPGYPSPHRPEAGRSRADAGRPTRRPHRPRLSRPPVRLAPRDVLRAAAAGWRIDELPVPYAPRPAGPRSRAPSRHDARRARHEPCGCFMSHVLVMASRPSPDGSRPVSVRRARRRRRPS